MLKNSIEEFSWGLEQIDIPTGFEQYTTTLEMTLLPSNKLGTIGFYILGKADDRVHLWDV